MAGIPPLVPGAGAPGVRSSEDVISVLPSQLATDTVSPVRDAFLEALTSLLQEYQFRGDVARAQMDVSRATENYLSALSSDRDLVRALDEKDLNLRTRVLGAQVVVTPEAIAGAVNAMLAPFTTLECQLVDAMLDRWFLNNGDPYAWHSFIGGGPNYPDRYFEDDAINNDGIFRPNSAPGGARVWSDSYGRAYLLRLPDLGYLSLFGLYCFSDPTQAQSESAHFYPGKGTTPNVAAFPNGSSVPPLAIYRAIVNTVNLMTGQSVRWSMIADIY